MPRQYDMMTENTALLPPAPRRVRWTDRAVAARVIPPALMLLVGGLIVALPYRQYRHTSRLTHEGIMTRATVTGTQVLEGRRPTYLLYVAFPQGDKLRHSTVDCRPDQYTKYGKGSTITITYLPSDASDAQIGKVFPSDERNDGQNFQVVLGAVMACAILLIGVIEGGLWSDYILLRHGIETTARIHSVTEQVYSQTVRHRFANSLAPVMEWRYYKIVYGFDCDDGRKQEVGVAAIDPNKQPVPASGDAIVILYRAGSPWINRPLASLTTVTV